MDQKLIPIYCSILAAVVLGLVAFIVFKKFYTPTPTMDMTDNTLGGGIPKITPPMDTVTTTNPSSNRMGGVGMDQKLIPIYCSILAAVVLGLVAFIVFKKFYTPTPTMDMTDNTLGGGIPKITPPMDTVTTTNPSSNRMGGVGMDQKLIPIYCSILAAVVLGLVAFIVFKK
ncbi:UNVERIFIED_CONTAM: hypothetical protein FKN15_042836 [Acipenser sinensis]